MRSKVVGNKTNYTNRRRCRQMGRKLESLDSDIEVNEIFRRVLGRTSEGKCSKGFDIRSSIWLGRSVIVGSDLKLNRLLRHEGWKCDE